MVSWKVVVCLLAAAGSLAARAEEGAGAAAAAGGGGAAEASAAAATPGGAAEAAGAAPGAAEAEAPEGREFGESISVTATRAARRTRDVPQAIAVVGKEQIEDTIVFNVKDVVAGTPGVLVETKNGGYDSRLLIRGAGLKASYGVREIMLLRDGVPLTDPDSFSRLDWIDTSDIERIEISKGPGNLFSPGSAGGAVQIISRSVFDPGADRAQVGLGTLGSTNLHLRSSGTIRSNALAVTASFRQQDNPWRLWNEFDSRQVSLKHGLLLGEHGSLESEVAYTEADLQLPGAMDGALYREFRATGTQEQTSEPWRHSGRYSRILFVNSKWEQRLGRTLLKPRVYYNQWTHLHPVTGAINDTHDWTRTAGGDLEGQHEHALAGVKGTLVAGVTGRVQWNDDARKYQYRDVVHAGGVPTGRILETLSDDEGDLLERQSQRTWLAGVFVQESLRPHDRVLVDVGLRLDRTDFRVRQDELGRYDWARGTYVAGSGASVTSRTFDLPAPKVGVSVRATRAVSLYASAARAFQVPSESEIVSNETARRLAAEQGWPAIAPLDASASTAFEVGVKARGAAATLDLAAYHMAVADEIVGVSYRPPGAPSAQTVYQNAGETEKQGVEAAASFRLPWDLEAGLSYAYSDYTYVRFTERVGAEDVDRSGNRLPYVPRHQYGAFASWRHASGLRLRAQANTWGRYWMDNANTATYAGYQLLTSLGAAWSFGRHELVLDVENVFDQRYAMQATRDTGGRDLFSAGAPRSVAFGYRFHPGGRP
jgi:iron complex outermembrane receptor protein